MNTKFFLLINIAFFFKVSCYSQINYNSTYLDNFPQYKQKNSKLCWAATYEMVQNYAMPNGKICQCAIVSKIPLLKNCGTCLDRKCGSTCNQPIAKYDYYTYFGITSIATNASLTDINNILKEKSLIIGEGYDGINGDHFLAGYGTEVANGNEFILVNDPYRGGAYSLMGKNVVEIRHNLPSKDIETVVSIGTIANRNQNQVIINTKQPKYPDAKLISLSSKDSANLCSNPTNKCFNISYNYIDKTGVGSVVTDIFEVYALDSKFSTKFKKINEKWEPMVVFGLKDTFSKINFSITARMPNGETVKITKKAESGDIVIKIGPKKIPFEFAIYPPNLHTVIKYKYNGVKYVIDDREFPVKVITEQSLINDILENPTQHH